MSYTQVVIKNGKKYEYSRTDVETLNSMEFNKLSFERPMIRPCLKCSMQFFSRSNANRLCNKCKELFRESDEFVEWI